MTLMTATPPPVEAVADGAIEAAVQRAAKRMPPQWGLDDLVAVNPFLGWADHPLPAAAERLRRCLGDGPLPTPRALADAWRAGRFDEVDLEIAAEALGAPEAAPRLRQRLAAAERDEPTIEAPRVIGVAERFAAAGQGDWPDAVAADLARFCAARIDTGVARFAADRGPSLWADWRAHASVDRSMAVRGLPGFHAWVVQLPADAAAARAWLLRSLGVEASATEDYAVHLLGRIQGWTGVLRAAAWHGDGVGAVPDLLTAALAYEAGLALLHRSAPALLRRPLVPHAAPTGVEDGLVLLAAAEHGVRRTLLRGLERPAAPAPAVRPAAHAVFCIDVRSEPFRRALEGADSGIATAGFAGFFGLAIAVDDGHAKRPQCPVLLQPGATVGLPAGPRRLSLFGHLRRAAVGGFAYMETAGFTALGPLLAETLGLRRKAAKGDVDACAHPEHARPLDVGGIAPAARIAMARAVLTHLHLEGTPGRLVLLCGHDASTANNAQAAGLACGACGGHGGGSNARAAAAILNDPAVRAAIAGDERALPADTVVVAGVHDTATDRVRLLDVDAVPAGHRDDLARLERALAAAGATARARRAGGLPGLAAGDADDAMRARVRDWAEVRPEWGLAGCAAFIAAARSRTLGLDLGGRAFLHSYDAARDTGDATLELILTAPVVVASWISLQYSASAAVPHRWGSGTKTIHNPVGSVGVLQGNHGDLAVGLSWQSVHDGERLRHDPVRLHVVVEAEPRRIDAILARHPGVAQLVDHGWILLSAIVPGGTRLLRRTPAGSWE